MNILRINKLNGEISSKELFNDKGQIIEKITNQGTKTFSYYDENGRVIKEKIINKNFNNTKLIWYIYDEWGNTILTGEGLYIPEFIVVKKTDNIYEYKTNELKNSLHIMIKYDKNHRIIKFINVKNNYWFTNIYDKNGILLKFNSSNGLKEKYYYNDNNQLIKFKRTLKNKVYEENYVYKDDKIVETNTSTNKTYISEYFNTDSNKIDDEV